MNTTQKYTDFLGQEIKENSTVLVDSADALWTLEGDSLKRFKPELFPSRYVSNNKARVDYAYNSKNKIAVGLANDSALALRVSSADAIENYSFPCYFCGIVFASGECQECK